MSQIQSTFSAGAGIAALIFLVVAGIFAVLLSAPVTPAALRWIVTAVWGLFHYRLCP